MDFTLFLSIGSAVLSCGIVYGVMKTDIANLKEYVKDLADKYNVELNGMRMRLELEIQKIKDEYIHEMKGHEKESDKSYKKLLINLTRLQEQVKAINNFGNNSGGGKNP